MAIPPDDLYCFDPIAIDFGCVFNGEIFLLLLNGRWFFPHQKRFLFIVYSVSCFLW